MRVFTAIELAEGIKDEIQEVSMSLNSSGIKLVNREELHITLTFSGDINEGSINTMIELLKSVKSEAFTAKVNGIGVFDPEFIRVIFAKVTEGSSEIRSIYKQIASAFQSHNINFDIKEYVPHITIARVKSIRDRQSLLSFIEEYKAHEFGSFTVSSFSLIKSVLTPQGPEYSILHKFDF